MDTKTLQTTGQPKGPHSVSHPLFHCLFRDAKSKVKLLAIAAHPDVHCPSPHPHGNCSKPPQFKQP